MHRPSRPVAWCVLRWLVRQAKAALLKELKAEREAMAVEIERERRAITVERQQQAARLRVQFETAARQQHAAFAAEQGRLQQAAAAAAAASETERRKRLQVASDAVSLASRDNEEVQRKCYRNRKRLATSLPRRFRIAPIALMFRQWDRWMRTACLHGIHDGSIHCSLTFISALGTY